MWDREQEEEAMSHRRRMKEGGFTLLELLMVVIIIAILASIALPQYLRVAERSRAAEALTTLGAIRSAELRYKSQDPSGNFVADLASLDVDIPGQGVVTASSNWTFDDLTATNAGANAVAKRSGGTYINGKIEIDLDSGAICTDKAVWGLDDTDGVC